MAQFKADFLNTFVEENQVRTIIEYGCGDGEQLRLARYPSYVGFDVSRRAIEVCIEKFRTDTSKSFFLMNQYGGELAELTLSIDVLYHLVEDDVYASYMHRLFKSSLLFVIIYSCNTEEPLIVAPHIRCRRFEDWVVEHAADWELERHVPNEHPFRGAPSEGSISDFYVYRRRAG